MLASTKTINVKADNKVKDMVREACAMFNSQLPENTDNTSLSLCGKASPKRATFRFYEGHGKHSFDNPDNDVCYVYGRSGLHKHYNIYVNTSAKWDRDLMAFCLFDNIRYLLSL